MWMNNERLICYLWHMNAHPGWAYLGVRVPPSDDKHDDPPQLLTRMPTSTALPSTSGVGDSALVLRRRIMIDWLELDLHQTLKCAAGNYFALERERMGERREGVGGWISGGRAAVSSQWHQVANSGSIQWRPNHRKKEGHVAILCLTQKSAIPAPR